ncbi:flagellar type III secretion system pore protein FliP [Steroidobacter flavus]|uniref:Flagellar biosynthetic protein FliP n=1 Tax=Steroidobacter flavus TaxID=1842136 RepID=A0ABV8SYY4_9GAMM
MTSSRHKVSGKWLLGGALLLLPGVLFAAAAPNPGFSIDFTGSNGASLAQPLRIILMLTALSVLPAVVIAMTSFTRTIIVLSMLRHAFGMQDTPPNMVLLSLALFLTLFTMAPAIERINQNSIQPLLDQNMDFQAAVTNAVDPLREFMVRQTREKDLALMLEIAKAPRPESIESVKTIHLVPAFLLSELKTAFQIGFVIFLPFLLLDLVVASVLMSMGMLMVPPTIISLPLKVLMFVLIDGWGLVVRALLGSFH